MFSMELDSKKALLSYWMILRDQDFKNGASEDWRTIFIVAGINF